MKVKHRCAVVHNQITEFTCEIVQTNLSLLSRKSRQKFDEETINDFMLSVNGGTDSLSKQINPDHSDFCGFTFAYQYVVAANDARCRQSFVQTIDCMKTVADQKSKV